MMKARQDLIRMKDQEPWKCKSCSYKDTIFCKVTNGTAKNVSECDGPYGEGD